MAAPLTRELVIATARAQLEASGASQLSLRAVARELNVTAPALYLYVADKRDLLAAIAEDHFERLVERFEAVVDPDPIVRIRQLSHAYVDHALSSPALFPLMFRYPPTQVANIDAFPPAARAFEVAAATTQEAIDRGLLNVTSATEASTIMWCAMHGVAEIALMGFTADTTATNELLDRVVDTIIAGQQA